MIHVHDLNGCAPTPLAHYLKALGILRLVSEQKDPQARGWWDGERFRLATRIDRETFVRFLQDEYSPTPVFNPWGGRSGFYGGASEKTARAALTGIEQSSDIRFDDFKNAIRTIRRLIDALPKKKTPEGESAKVAQVEDSAIDTSAKGEKPEDEGKAKLIQDIRREVRGRSSVWMDAVVAVVTSGERPTLAFPALFGTGGNEGSKGYASLYMAAIRECLLRHQWDHALPNAVFADAPAVANDWKESFGQFLPEGVASPWDLIFAFEGACTIRSSVSSRNATHSDRWMSSPFYVAPTSYGFASAARLDEFALNKGKEVPGRGEQWFPLWSAPMLQTELSQLFAEGRVTTRRGSTRRSGWSMMRAATSLGVRAGIREFVRYGYLQRNNLASHMAVPVGRVRVPEQLVPEAACLDDLDAKRDWPAAIFREARRKNASPWLRFAQRRMQESLFGVLTHPGEPNRWQALLLGMAEIEGIQARGSGFRAGPVPRLRPEWVGAADDGSAEFRLALSAALQWPSVRVHWLPLDRKQPGQFATTGDGGDARIARDSAVVMTGRDGIDDAIALVERRLVEASQHGDRHLPLQAAPRADAYPADLSAWLSGGIDANRTMALARALMALDRELWPQQIIKISRPATRAQPVDAWMAIRLALLPWPLPDGPDPGADPAIFRRLASGDAATAFELAHRRLRAKGINASVRVAAVAPEVARRWASAIAFPITPETAAAFARCLDPTTVQENLK